MLERIKAVLDARKENDKGFSLVELAVVIVIIGILVAVAIPIFLGMQGSANEAARESAVANGAAMFAAEIAKSDGGSMTEDQVDALETKINESVGVDHPVVLTGNDLDTYCVTSDDDATVAKGSCP